ncbi:MAG TPA: AAA family ATPase, partial [Acidimicrobiales bacterium]|nr:AAA family ATPase [Acidimicrobiales bacterium]
MGNPTTSQHFPFSAVVGSEDVKLALLLNALDPAIGGVLLRGEKGSAKSTLARGLAALLPGGAHFVELPVGATEDRLVGGFDFESVLADGVHRFKPGLLAAADGGVLYVDEVNLLPDHLVDVLLDVAASGVNRVERDGLSHQHSSRFVLVGSMNPEEGELRPQLLDRFGMVVDVLSIVDAASRAEAVSRRLDFDDEPSEYISSWAKDEMLVAEKIASAQTALGNARKLGSEFMQAVSATCTRLHVEGLRADIVICRAAAALAAWEGRDEPGLSDIRRVAPLALAHRMRRSPLDRHGLDRQALDDVIDSAFGNEAAPTESGRESDVGNPRGKIEGPANAGHQAVEDVAGSGGREARGLDSSNNEMPMRIHAGNESSNEGENQAQSAGRVTSLQVPRGILEDQRVRVLNPGFAAGSSKSSRGRKTVESPGGRNIGSRVPSGSQPSAIALAPTVMAAATRTGMARAQDGTFLQGSTAIALEDIREPIRVKPATKLIVFALDTSGSMGVEERVDAAKGAIMGLLLSAYASRYRIALVTFGGEGARVELTPTGSVEVAAHRLEQLTTGGATPLAEGIRTALQIAGKGSKAGSDSMIVLVSDCRANATEDPIQEAMAAARDVAISGIPVLV